MSVDVATAFQEQVATMVSARIRAESERLEHDCFLAIIGTPVPYQCRLEIVQQDGVRGRRVACRWR